MRRTTRWRWRWLTQPATVGGMVLLAGAGATVGWHVSRASRAAGAGVGTVGGLVAALLLALAVERLAAAMAAGTDPSTASVPLPGPRSGDAQDFQRAQDS